jgi:hypothetical protein
MKLNIVTGAHVFHLFFCINLPGYLWTYALLGAYYANEQIAQWHMMVHSSEKKWFPYMLNPYPLSVFMMDLQQLCDLHFDHHRYAGSDITKDPDAIYYRFGLLPSYILCVLQPEISFFQRAKQCGMSAQDCLNMVLRIAVMYWAWRTSPDAAWNLWLLMRAFHGVSYFMGTWMCHHNVEGRGTDTTLSRLLCFWVGGNMVSMVEGHGDHHEGWYSKFDAFRHEDDDHHHVPLEREPIATLRQRDSIRKCGFR